MSAEVVRHPRSSSAPTGRDIQGMTADRVADWKARHQDRQWRISHGLGLTPRPAGGDQKGEGLSPVDAARRTPPGGRGAAHRRMLWAALAGLGAAALEVAAVWVTNGSPWILVETLLVVGGALGVTACVRALAEHGR